MAAPKVFSYAQLEQLWINAGGSKATAPIAAAIAEAESGGNPLAENDTDNNGTQTSWGLWQISDGTHNQPVPNIKDPVTNAKAAVAKYNASGWQPWGTYTSGAYTAYLSNSTPPDATGVPASAGAGGGGTATLTSASATPCVWTVPSLGPIGGGCLLAKSQARAMLGGLVITGAVLIALPAVFLLAAAGFRGAGRTASEVAAPLERTPGYGHAIRAARSASQTRAANRQGQEAGRRAAARRAGRAAARSEATAS